MALLAVITYPAEGSTERGSSPNGTGDVHSHAPSQPATGSRRPPSDDRTGTSPRH